MTKLFQIQSTAGNYADMHKYILECLADIPHAEVTVDDTGNIYVAKGDAETYPVLICHTDTLHKVYDNFQVDRMPKSHIWIGARLSGGQIMQAGIGGESKCGIYIVLKLLKEASALKCVFFVDASHQYKGSSNADMSFFDDARYVLNLDRYGLGNIVTNAAGTDLCSDSFKTLLATIGKKYNYVPTSGGRSDIAVLKSERGLAVSGANISVGFYDGRETSDHIVEKHLNIALEFVRSVVKSLTQVYPHTKKNSGRRSADWEDLWNGLVL